MAVIRRRRGAAGRLVLAAAFMLAGAGGGTAAVLGVSGSGLIRGAGGAGGAIAGLCAAAWAETAKQRRETRAVAARERDQVLDPAISAPADDLSVLGLLLPTRHDAAPFRGRAADLAWLQAWLDNPGAHPVALVTGPGGVGKTRLVTQFASTRPPPWAAGWLHAGRGATALAAVRACAYPALILIDDAGTSPDIAALLGDLAAHPRGVPVRVILTARTADALAQVAGQLPEPARWIIAPENLPVRPVGPFGSPDDHARWFGEAVRAYAAARRTPPPDLPDITATGSTASADEPVLTIQAQALLAVLETQRRRPQHSDLQTLPFYQVAQALFTHEQRRWQQVAQQPDWGLADLTAPVQQRAIAALMLTGAAEEPEAITALRAVPDLADATAERLARIARWAFYLYLPGPVRIQPDMLAEWFLITQLTGPGLAAHLNDLTGQNIPALLMLLAHASDHLPAAVPLYTRLIQADPASRAAAGADAALTASTARPLLDASLAALVTSTPWSPTALADFQRHLPEGTLPRTQAALSAVAVHHTRETGTPEDLTQALHNYGSRLRDLGRHREALAAREEALVLCQGLAAADPALQPGLANALNSRGASLRDLGRHREALASQEEAVALFRELAAANPAHQPGLANALNGRGVSLSDLGRHGEALAFQEEAVALFRELAGVNLAHQPDLARALNNRGVSLSDLGRHGEALAFQEEAVALYRELAAANPAHQPDLANALNNRGVSLSDLGRPGEALAFKEEAVALYRELAAANPAHQPDLANALNNRGVSLSDLGREQEALTYAREALELYATLAQSDPDVYEKTFQHHLAELRRTYDLRGDQSTGVSLHLHRDNRGNNQP